MRAATGDLVNLGRGLTSSSCGFERPTMRALPIAVLVCISDETALVISTDADLVWVMRYRCEIQT